MQQIDIDTGDQQPRHDHLVLAGAGRHDAAPPHHGRVRQLAGASDGEAQHEHPARRAAAA